MFFVSIQEKHNLSKRTSDISDSELTNSVFVKTEPIFEQNDSLESSLTTQEALDNISVKEEPIKASTKEAKTLKTEPKKTSSTEEFDPKILKHCQMVCEVCLKEFSTFQKLKQHFKKKHQSDGYAICCSKKFHRYTILLDHINHHENPQIFQCGICSRFFSAKRSLLLHENSQHKEKSFKCSFNGCNKIYATNQSLRYHVKHYHEIARKNLECDVCGKM